MSTKDSTMDAVHLAAVTGQAKKPSETLEVSGNEATLTKTTHARIKTLEQLIKTCEIDTSIWEVERWVCNKWEVGGFARATRELGDEHWVRPHGRGRLKVSPLFQVKAWLRRKVAIIAVRAEIEDMRKAVLIRKNLPKPRKIATRAHSGNLLEISMPDLHIGRLSWGPETGHGDYDTQIAMGRFEKALETLLQRATVNKPEKILLVVGNDLLNYDNRENTTTRGTLQDTDSRYQKVFVVARNMKVRAIERCRLIAPVVVKLVSGNHDLLAVWHMGDSLSIWFRGHKDVEIDNTPTLRKYLEWGRVMLMFTHGDKGKRADYPLLMATEQREMFGRTIWHEIHTGDRHQVRLEEKHGVRVRILPSLAEPSHWEAEQCYTGNIRSAEAYTWNRKEGLIGTATYTVLEGNGAA